MAHRDERCDDGRRRQGIARLKPGGARLVERLARGGVVVRGRGAGSKRLEDAGTNPCVEVARRGAQGRRVELASFSVRREARGGISGGERGAECLLAPSRPFVVQREERIGADIRPANRGVRREAVQPASLRLRDRRVDRIADQGVSEPVAARDVQRQQDEMVRQLTEWIRQPIERLAADRAQQVEVEGAPDDGPHPRHVGGRFRALAEAGLDGVLDGVWDIGVTDVAGRRLGASPKQREQLFHVERDTVGAEVDCVDEVAGRRKRRSLEQRGHRRRLLDRQPAQADFLGAACGEQAGAPLARGDARVELVAPVGGDDEDRQLGDPASERLEDLERQVVGPVQVLEPEQERLAGRELGWKLREQVGDVQDEQPTAAARIGFGCGPLPEPSREAFAQRRQIGLPLERARQVDEDGSRDLEIAGIGPGAHGPKARAARPPLDRAEQPRLAKPSLPGDEQHTAVARPDLVEPPVAQGEQVVASDEDGTDERAGHPRREV